MSLNSILCRTSLQWLRCTHCYRSYSQPAICAKLSLNRQLSTTSSHPSTASSIDEGRSPSDAGMFKRLAKLLGSKDSTLNSKSLLNTSATRLYVCCTEYSDFNLFIERFGIKDTLGAWCNLVQLHIWMATLRLKNHHLPLHNDFIFMIKRLNSNMWDDIENRVGKIASGKQKKDGILTLQYQYTALVPGYDEGYFTSDKVLAAAIWRSLLEKNEELEPGRVLELVEYIHKNLVHLQSISDEQLINEGIVTFIPLDSNRADGNKEKSVRKRLEQI